MVRSLPVLIVVLLAQLTQLGAGVAAALGAPEACACCADAAEADGVAASDDQWRALAPCGSCCDDGEACEDGCGDCRCRGAQGGVAMPPVAVAQPTYAAAPIALAFDVGRDPDTGVPFALERPPRAPAPAAGRRPLDR